MYIGKRKKCYKTIHQLSIFRDYLMLCVCAFNRIVALPEMFQGCDNFGISESISRFVCPITSALKADGPAVFISCACMFVTQLSIGTVPVSTAVVIW